MIFYATNRRFSQTHDYYVALGLIDGFLIFKFNLGSGPLTLRSTHSVINVTSSITARFERHRKVGKLSINRQTINGTSPGLMQGLDLSGNVYLGCVPTNNWTSVSQKTGFTKCFTGIVTRLLVNNKMLNLGQNVATKGLVEDDETAHQVSWQDGVFYDHQYKSEPKMLNVQSVDTCDPNPCLNGATCVVFHNANGFKCICPSDYTGYRCDREMKRCTPSMCNNGGKCVSNSSNISCLCSIGRSANPCQQGINITIPKFNGRTWIATRPLFIASQLNIGLAIKPADNSDGLLLYSGQTTTGTGDYFVVSLQAGHLIMSFDSGTGPVVVRSTKFIPANVWSHVHFKKVLRTGYIIINGTKDANASSQGLSKSLDLWTPMYIGGVNLLSSRVATNISTTSVNAANYDNNGKKMTKQNELAANGVQLSEEIQPRVGFKGCIRDLNIRDEDEDLTNPNVIASDGIENCAINACASGPCHRGTCENLSVSPGYRCLCPTGFFGQHCVRQITSLNCRLENQCQNNGICRATNLTHYKCDCFLGYAGKNCQRVLQVSTSAQFQGNGYVALSEDLFSATTKHHFIRFRLRTNSTEGLLLWQGQTPSAFEKFDYFGVGVRHGRIFISLQLGGASASLTSDQAISDDREHAVKIARIDRSLSVQVDGMTRSNTTLTETPRRIGTKGNIYVGGVPQSQLITFTVFPTAFVGCIKDVRLQSSAPINFLADGILGYNVANC